ncbi:putative phage tail fiber protein [Corchorus olitorius]|uniref:Phage tail fiber protein n=1 Tax=Corchorus olitorius TaxID=93759 RepID=A0A1R3KQF7_9ROSI|nr:putative phage tail fiber protein [Corchorus olitorius]
MRRHAHDWKNAEYKRLYLPVASESSTRSYKDWHRDRVKDLVFPPEKDPHYPVGPDSLDELTHLRYEVVRERENQVRNLEAEKKELWEEHKRIIVVWSLTMQQRAMFRNMFYQAHHNFMCCQYQLDEFLDKLSDVKDKFLDLGRGINGLIDAWDKSEDSLKDALARMRKGVAVARELKKQVQRVYGEAYPIGPARQRLINCLQNVISSLDFFIGLFDNDKAVVVY